MCVQRGAMTLELMNVYEPFWDSSEFLVERGNFRHTQMSENSLLSSM